MSDEQGIGRFGKEASIGGLVGGVLSGVPLLGALNCCCCSLNLGGVWLGLYLWLNAHKGEKLTMADGAIFGAMSGALAGLLASLLGMLSKMASQDQVLDLIEQAGLPSDLERQISALVTNPLLDLAQIPINMALYGGFGVLGGMLAMQLLFRDRLSE